MSHENLEAFLSTITTDEVMASIPHGIEGIQKAKFVLRKEVMATVKDGRYSGVDDITDAVQ